ncbi:hypothetical protein GCM10009569_09750 [Arthrobacter russicus]
MAIRNVIDIDMERVKSMKMETIFGYLAPVAAILPIVVTLFLLYAIVRLAVKHALQAHFGKGTTMPLVDTRPVEK